MENVGVAIVGGGQAGLATSYHLKQAGVTHVVLERARVAQAWRSRWDSFTLVTPNWTMSLPGRPYPGPDPDGFSPRDEIVAYFESYVKTFQLPVRNGVDVRSVRAGEGGRGFVLETSAGTIAADAVVVASGSFTKPKIPAWAKDGPKELFQIHTSQYKSPSALPPGGVIVAGSGQSGVQIAEELLEAGRRVFVAAGTCPGVPRTYRGKDIVYWLAHCGLYERRLADMPSPKARQACTPQATGKRGGHTIGLAELAAKGATVTGRIAGFDGAVVRYADDLPQSIEAGRVFTANLLAAFDAYIERERIAAPPKPAAAEVKLPPSPPSLDLRRESVSTLVWATGFAPDYSFVHFPVFDAEGFPVTKDGVTDVPGLFFVGVHFLRKMKSVLLVGIGEDAAVVAQGVVAHAKK